MYLGGMTVRATWVDLVRFYVWFAANLCADLVQIYAPIYCNFMLFL